MKGFGLGFTTFALGFAAAEAHPDPSWFYLAQAAVGMLFVALGEIFDKEEP